MNYREDCIAAFVSNLREQNVLEADMTELAKQAFISGFDYGSLNGASDYIKERAVKDLQPAKDNKAREIIEIMNRLGK